MARKMMIPMKNDKAEEYGDGDFLVHCPCPLSIDHDDGEFLILIMFAFMIRDETRPLPGHYTYLFSWRLRFSRSLTFFVAAKFLFAFTCLRGG